MNKVKEFFAKFFKQDTQIKIVALKSATRTDRTELATELGNGKIILVDISALGNNPHAKDNLISFLEGAVFEHGELTKLDENLLLLTPQDAMVEDDNKEGDDENED